MTLKRFSLLFFFLACSWNAFAQCGGQIMEPGFQFLTSSRGCAPFTVQIETLYLASTPGTTYYVDWGDGTPEQIYAQSGATGVVLVHSYPNSPVDCGYDLVIDAENTCNPRGSVVPVETQVIVWTNDVMNVDPGVFRVCQGFATSLQFTDNSDWNCFPRATRENNEPRWIQWIYGTGPAANRIPGIDVDGVSPGGFPYNNPNPANNPKYPVLAPGEVSLPINVPATVPADIGREFELSLKNWNQCNAYDNDLTDGDPFNPVSGDLINGDNAPMIETARIVIVDSPDPSYQTRLNNASGPIQTIFCVDEDIYFENLTPTITGSNFQYTWEFFDNSTGIGAPLSTSNSANPIFSYATSGQKLIRLTVRDANAAGNCEEVYESTVIISPTLVAQIGVTDLADTPITPEFCQSIITPQTFDVRFSDQSTGVVTPQSRWRWEFYDESNVLIGEFPGSGAYSASPLGPYDRVFSTVGVYRVRFIVRDNVTSCESVDETFVYVFENPVADFQADKVCEGEDTHFTDLSTLNSIDGESIVSREWDFDYDGVTFNKDPAFDNQTDFDRPYSTAGTYDVALRVMTDRNSCTDIIVKEVTVDPLPIADITASAMTGCSVLSVTFANNGVGSQPDVIDEYIWEIDEGAGYVVDSIQSPSDPFFSDIFIRDFYNLTTSNKTFDVRLRVVTQNNCESISAPVSVTVLPGPRSGFSTINYSPFDDNCSPISVDFQVDAETQSLNPTSYDWRINDTNGLVHQENTGADPNFSYTFSNTTQSVKDYFVTLTSTLANGCFGDSTRTIRVNPVPSGAFTIDTLALDCEVMTIAVEAQQKGLTTYNWSLSENSIVTFSSSTVGDGFEYTITKGASDIAVQVSLETINFANCPSPVEVLDLLVPAADNMNTSFTASPPSQVLPNATVTLNNTTNAGPWTYLWDFGDGNTSTDPTIADHTYDTYGTYTITLTVTNEECIETAAQTIEIQPVPPLVDFDYNPAYGCAPLMVHFTNLSQYADPNSYFWRFGDGNTSTSTNPDHIYFEAGVYTVSLSASNILQDTVTEVKSMIIEVFEQPMAVFDVRPSIVLVPDNPIYTNNRSTGASTFTWLFGDGESSNEPEPIHYYQEEGVYTISLIAENSFGCSDTLTRENIVEAKTSGRVLVPNAFSPNLSGPMGGETGPTPGTNDIFLPMTREVREFEMLIFNRWGELLFQSTNQNTGWDGYYNGRLCPQDVYVYKLNVVFENGDKSTRVGDVNLIR